MQELGLGDLPFPENSGQSVGESESSRFTFSGGAVDRPWLTPLFECAALVATNELAATPATFTSLWDPAYADGSGYEDAAKHSAFMDYALPMISERMPWLIPLAVLCGATFSFGEGRCLFAVPNRLGESFEIPELAPYLWLLPWRTEADDMSRAH